MYSIRYLFKLNIFDTLTFKPWLYLVNQPVLQMDRSRAFQTLVTLDLETTGLPYREYNLTKITEISLVACIPSCSQNGKLPRILNKLTLGVNPMKGISHQASQISGIENEFLEDLATFNDDLVVILNNFLKRLPEPICIVAHNGNKFDFPIFRKHLLACQTSFIGNIYCADSYSAFQVILPKAAKLPQSRSQRDQMNSPAMSELSQGPSDSVLMDRININETTPKVRSTPYNTQPIKRATDHHNKLKQSAVRRLQFDEVTETDTYSETDSDNMKGLLNNFKESDPHHLEASQNSNKILKSYKLSDIYNFLHDDDKVFHRAEDDCLALLSCILKYKEEFLNWVEVNACLLSNIKPLP